jgi:hypothetical protein
MAVSPLPIHPFFSSFHIPGSIADIVVVKKSTYPQTRSPADIDLVMLVKKKQ